jgi:hypothetical protein
MASPRGRAPLALRGAALKLLTCGIGSTSSSPLVALEAILIARSREVRHGNNTMRGLELINSHLLEFSETARGSVRDLPMMLFWSPVIFSGAGYYLMAVADLMDGAVALTTPATVADRRRSQFKVIQGGKY